MAARTLLVAAAGVALAVGLVVADDTQKVVLAGGTTVEVTEVKIQSGFVYLIFADGRKQAYPLADVDIEASGLAQPRTEPVRPASQPRSMALAQADAEAVPRLKITDADVAHVNQPGEAAEGEGEGEGEGGEGSGDKGTVSLVVSRLMPEFAGGILTLSGTVDNNGGRKVASINLRAEAMGAEGNVIGTGNATLPQELAPGKKVDFTMSFPVQAQPLDVRVRASAAVVDFDLGKIPPPDAPQRPAGAAPSGG